VAQGTIEHGMLSLLSFKQSLFSGVLDKGKDEVFIGGTRLKRFMDSVDQATRAIPESMPRQQAGAEPDGESIEEEVSVAAQEPKDAEPGQDQAWNDMIAAGLTLVQKLGQTLFGAEGQPREPSPDMFSRFTVETDHVTGQRHLTFPMPKKETIQSIAALLNEFSKKL